MFLFGISKPITQGVRDKTQLRIEKFLKLEIDHHSIPTNIFPIIYLVNSKLGNRSSGSDLTDEIRECKR